MRDPSLHVTKSQLVNILKEINEVHNKFINLNPCELASRIISRAKSRSVTHRALLISNDKIEKKAKKLTSSTRYDADYFANLLYNIRKRNKHRGILPLKPGHRDWLTLKEVTANAISFCDDFNLSYRKGFIEYLSIAIERLNRFHINKLLSFHEVICSAYEARLEISTDLDPDMTKELYKVYATRVVSNTGISDDSYRIPEKYVWFVRARAEAENLNVSVKLFMDAQFDFLDFTKGIPHPTQLVGDKAKDRVIRYAYKKGIKIK